MMKQFTKFFSSEGVYASTNYFYRLLVLNLWFSIMTLPWTLLNGIIKLAPLTYGFYVLTAVWVFPNIQTVFQLFKSTDDDNDDRATLSFKAYRKQLWKNFSSKLHYSLIVSGFLGLLLGETYLILKVSFLRFLAPLFFIVVAFLTVSVIWAYYLNNEGQLSLKKMIQTSLIMAWRYPLKSILYFLIISLWASIGYWLPVVNFLVSNVGFFYLLHVLCKKHLKKLFEKHA